MAKPDMQISPLPGAYVPEVPVADKPSASPVTPAATDPANRESEKLFAFFQLPEFRLMNLFLLPVLIFFASACRSDTAEGDLHFPAVADEVLTAVPDWAKEAVWYQIFVERFRNGDASNDPRLADIEGSWPHNKPASWRVTPWTSDWYHQEGWALESGKEFYRTVQMRRYGGDLQGVIDKLDYLEDLGITAIYFNPLNDSPSLHKYDARSYHHIDRNFGPDPDGDLEIMQREDPSDPSTWEWTSADRLFLLLIEKAKDRGIRVVMDYSWNHTGITFWAWQDVLERQGSSPYADWYQIVRFDDPATPENEFEYEGWAGVPELPQFRRYGDGADEPFVHGQPVKGDLHPDLKQHIFAVTRRWLDPMGNGDLSKGVDGFRLDVAELIPMGFWRDYRRVVRSINPEAYLVGELWWEDWPDRMMDPSPWLQGDVFDAAMNYRWYLPSRSYFAGANADEPITTPTAYIAHLDSVSEGMRPEVLQAMMNLTASHDSPRFSTSIYNRDGRYKYRANPRENPAYRLNRPDDRTWRDMKLILVHQFTWIGAPHIWMGDEFFMWGADDPDNRKPLIWPDLEFEPESADPLGRARQTDRVQADTTKLAFYRTLARMRRDNPVFAHGQLETLFTDDVNNTFAYVRYIDDVRAYVIFNNSEQPQSVSLEPEHHGYYLDLLQEGLILQFDSAQPSLEMPPKSARVLLSSSAMR
ncbi:MAG: alpha-amylase [Balneolaceae bacterium]|nr:MAG: alpha-amylase [Balneolaceae bacterium]